MEREVKNQINGLIERIRRGDKDAVAALHALLGNKLRFIAVKFFHNDFDADDAVQDFWLHIVDYCQKYKFSVNAYSYLCKCFENQCLSALRKKGVRERVMSVEDVALYERPQGDVSERQYALKQTFERAEKEMTDDERRVFALSLYGDETVREIADELGMSKSQAARLRASAVEKVKAALIKDGWDKNDA